MSTAGCRHYNLFFSYPVGNGVELVHSQSM